ncbi:GAF domain-containing protein [Marinomonas agarivorans]|nr:GAF domain-containing protein [Marinomonas agarivorans]
MFTIDTDTNLPKNDLYPALNKQLAALLAGETDLICNFAQFSAFIMQTVEQVNWVGFYFAKQNELVLGPYMGKVACTRIPFGRGVCGAAAASMQAQRVADVHAFDGHIACDSASASELVLPIVVDGDLIGVLDIDSPIKNRFDEVDQVGFEQLLTTLIQGTEFDWSL